MRRRTLRPDEEPYIKRFAQVFPEVAEFIEHFARLEHYPNHKERVFLAWCAWQAAASQNLMGFGAIAFYERFVRALEHAQEGLEKAVADFAEMEKLKAGPVDRRKTIEPNDEIGSCNDPFLLLCMYDGARFGLSYKASEKGRFEIARKLAIATQILCISAADAYEHVTGELTKVNFLAIERFYEPQMVTIDVHCAFLGDEGHHRLDPELPLRVSFEDELVTCPDMIRLPVPCRVVQQDGTRFYVYSNSRPKDRLSAIIRLERGSKLTDRRGLSHVVVAVEEAGELRVANRQDAAQFASLARQRLWRSPLRIGKDRGVENRISHPDFWDIKIVGRYLPRGSRMSTAVEHQITDIASRLNAEHADDELGHVKYKRKVVRKCVLPLWFPFEVYGIDWAAENGPVK